MRNQGLAIIEIVLMACIAAVLTMFILMYWRTQMAREEVASVRQALYHIKLACREHYRSQCDRQNRPSRVLSLHQLQKRGLLTLDVDSLPAWFTNATVQVDPSQPGRVIVQARIKQAPFSDAVMHLRLHAKGEGKQYTWLFKASELVPTYTREATVAPLLLLQPRQQFINNDVLHSAMVSLNAYTEATSLAHAKKAPGCLW